MNVEWTGDTIANANHDAATGRVVSKSVGGDRLRHHADHAVRTRGDGKIDPLGAALLGRLVAESIGGDDVTETREIDATDSPVRFAMHVGDR